MTTRQVGMLEVIASGVCFGFLGFFGKELLSHGVRPGELLALRFLMAAALMLAFLPFKQRPGRWLSLRQLLACLTLGICGYAVFAFCFFSALEGLSASLTVLLLYTYPALVAAGAWLLFKEKIPRQHWPALPLAGLGLLGLVWGEFSVQSWEALGFGIGSAVVYALYILCSSRWLRGVPATVAAPTIQLGAGLTLTALYLRDPARALSIIEHDWLLILGISLVSTVLAMSLFLAGLQKLRSWEVSLLSTTEPLVGVLVGALILGERLSGVQMLGGVALILSLVWVSVPVGRIKAKSSLSDTSARAS